MEYLEALLAMVANGAIIIFEFMGVGIIIYSGFTGFIKFLHKAPETKIYLAKGLAMGLEFKMGSEILRTVVVREWKEIGIVAGRTDVSDSLGDQGGGEEWGVAGRIRRADRAG